MKAVIVSVDFGDLLEVTLPYNRHHWSEVLVVTTPSDQYTIRVARDNEAKVYTTTSFYDNGAAFNKFKPLEEGLSFLGRNGWIALVDADVLWPKTFPPYRLVKGRLYSFLRRRLLLDVTQDIPKEEEWPSLPLDPQYSECMGFTQIFHASDRHLGPSPWHRLDLSHAALGDSLFQQKWPLHAKTWMNAEVLHLGNYAENWMGRVTKYRNGTTPANADTIFNQNHELKQSLWPAPEEKT